MVADCGPRSSLWVKLLRALPSGIMLFRCIPQVRAVVDCDKCIFNEILQNADSASFA